MKFNTTPYHYDLLKDNDRLSVFFEAINEYNSNNSLAYDLGCGSGILSYFLSFNFKKIEAIEKDKKAYICASKNLKSFDNIKVINSDILDYNFKSKADLIVCEMLDTALIDEEEIPVLNYAKKFLKKDGKIIPNGIINTCEIVNLKRDYIHWDENESYKTLSKPLIYSKFNFLDDINPIFSCNMTFQSLNDGIVNGLKITTYTLVNDNIICGPTPMFNPPLLIPLKEKMVKNNEFINVELKYIMGNGIESIEVDYL